MKEIMCALIAPEGTTRDAPADRAAAKPRKESERSVKGKAVQRTDSGNYLNCSDELKEELYI